MSIEENTSSLLSVTLSGYFTQINVNLQKRNKTNNLQLDIWSRRTVMLCLFWWGGDVGGMWRWVLVVWEVELKRRRTGLMLWGMECNHRVEHSFPLVLLSGGFHLVSFLYLTFQNINWFIFSWARFSFLRIPFISSLYQVHFLFGFDLFFLCIKLVQRETESTPRENEPGTKIK